MARENSGWGYTRIRGALSNLGHDRGRVCLRRLLKWLNFASSSDPLGRFAKVDVEGSNLFSRSTIC
jgi:hypothetical protein